MRVPLPESTVAAGNVAGEKRCSAVLGLVEQRERWGCANWRGSSKLFPRFSTQKYEENYFHSFSTIFHEIFLYIFFPSFFLHSKQGKEINFLNFFSFHLIFLGPNTPLEKHKLLLPKGFGEDVCLSLIHI